MDYRKAKKVMAFLQKIGVHAAFPDERETSIHIYDDFDEFLFSLDSDEEWEWLKKIADRIVNGLEVIGEKEN